jgi:hypothetical protein
MDVHDVSPPLRDRLGQDGTAGLVQLLARSRKECVSEVMIAVGDRFERRLVEETSKLRVDMTQGFASVRQEMAKGLGEVRQETAALGVALRQEMAAMAAANSALRQDIAAGTSAMRQEMADQRFEILKWAFLFWVGQFFAVASLVAVLIRFLRAGA